MGLGGWGDFFKSFLNVSHSQSHSHIMELSLARRVGVEMVPQVREWDEGRENI